MRKLTGLIFAAALAMAGDFWTDKKPTDWSKKEARKLLANSPWAKEAQLPSEMPENRDEGNLPPELRRDRISTLEDAQQLRLLLVRWESAAPVREAEARLEIEMPEKAQEFYMISVSGFRIDNRRRTAEAEPSWDEKKERLKSGAKLKIKGKDPIYADEVEVFEGEKGTTLVFFFSRKNVIQLSDREVTFQVNSGPLALEAKFVLKDMKFANELAL